jgi:hypothetical protein
VPSLKELGTVDRKLQERIQHHVLTPLSKAKLEDILFDDQRMQAAGYDAEELELVRVKWTELHAPGATHWLQALPIHPDFELDSEELQATLAHHLLLPRSVFLRVLGLPKELQDGCLCNLGTAKPLTEQHMAGCGHGGHRVERHNNVVRLIKSILKQAGCSRLTIEPRGLRNFGDQRPDLIYKDNNLPGNKRTVVMDAAIASVLPPGANHVLKAIEDPLYKAKLTQQRKIKENAHRMTATQRFVPMVFQSTGGYLSNVANVCRHPGLRTTELSSDLQERLTHPLYDVSSFVKLQLVMRVVKGTANNMVELVDRLCAEHGVARYTDQG